jgi:hypothetical protein
MNITINEPCHENWDAMIPNQQGAFCKSCQKSVIDFSKKTVAEIKDFFRKPQEGKVCGRFEQTQLAELSFDDFFARFRYWNFSKKAAVIFFLSFGFWLFSNEAIAQNEKHMLKGEVAYVEPVKQAHKDTTKKQHTQPTTVKQHVVMGKIKCTNPTPVQQEKRVIEPQKVLGQVTIPLPVKNEQKQPETIQAPQKVQEERLVMGMVVYRPQVVKEEPKNVSISTIQLVEEKNAEIGDNTPEVNESKVIVYPNPNSGRFTVETKEKQTLHLFDESGKLVLTQIVDGSAEINAEHLKNGVYTIHLTGTAHPTIKKIIVTR